MEENQAEGLEEKIEKEYKMKRYEKAVVINDPHFPFEDKKTIKLVNRFLKDYKPDIVFILGDLIDFYEISKFDKNPNRKTKLQDEIDAGVKELTYIRNILPKAKIYFKEGNHTHRLRSYLWKNPGLSSLKSLKLENLLNLQELNIKLIKYDKPFLYKGLYLDHGEKIRKYSAYTAKAELEELANDGITAHCFDKDTELLTQRGWIKGFSLLASDLVGTINKKTKRFEWNKINSFHEYDGYETLYRINGQSVDLLVTDEHGLLIKDRNGKQKEIRAKDMLNYRDRLYFYNCVPEPSICDNQYADKLRILIQIITDGSFESNMIRWHLKKQRKIDRLESLLSRNGIKYKKSETKFGTTRIWLNTEESRYWINKLNGIKKVPKWFVNLRQDSCSVILYEYSITDGCKNKAAANSYQLTSAKEDEIDILQEMFIRNGYRATKNNHGTAWTLTINTKDGIWLTSNNVSIEEYDGKVWCVNVNNGTLLVRRNGKVCVTLNTHRLGAYYKTTLGKDMVFYENGCLCKLDQEYAKNPNWQQGFSVVYFDTKTRNHSIQQVHIKKHKFIFNNKEYVTK